MIKKIVLIQKIFPTKTIDVIYDSLFQSYLSSIRFILENSNTFIKKRV